MRILLLSHEMTFTGAPNSLLNVARVLRSHRHKVDVFTLKQGSFSAVFKRYGFDVKIFGVDMFDTGESRKLPEQYDIAICNTVFCGEMSLKLQNILPTILYIREAENLPDILKDNGINEICIRKAKNIVCVSEYAARFIEKTYTPKKIHILHNFLIKPFFTTTASNKIKGKLRFLIAATIEPRKGIAVAIEAFKLLPKKFQSQAVLDIYGRTPEWSADYHMPLFASKYEGIEYHGELKQGKAKMYKKANVVLVPSLDESCSLTALEGAMYARPLIVTENVGAKYLINGNGFIVETGAPESLSQAMRFFIERKDELKKMGRNSYHSFKKHSNKREYYRGLNKIFQEVLLEENQTAVSVIVPVYNVESYLAKCLDSIISQTLKDIEIICVNDGATDNSPQILEEYAKRDGRIKIITQPNGGYGKAMNSGIAAAKGEYIGIVEPDDFILPEMYETLYNAANEYDCEIVKSDFYRFVGDGSEKTYWKTARDDRNYNRIIDPAEEKECFRFVMNTWCGIYRRDFLLSNNITHNETPGASFQDNGFWFKGFCRTKRMMFLDKAFYMNRRDNPGSSVANKEKVYCGNTEYSLIYEWMSDKPDIKEKFIDVLMMKKLHTYMFNLRRIAPRFRHEYIRKFSEEFKESYEKGELPKAIFDNKEWTDLMQLIRDPEEYYYTVERERIKVSVILPVYNCEKYLRQCLDSLTSQTLRDIEIICVNDGSTDSSLEILNEYAAADMRFVVIDSENRGAGAARNSGIEAACGKYLAFLDSDDWFEPDMLSAAYNAAENAKADITIFRSMLYDNQTGDSIPCTYSLRLDRLPQHRPFAVGDMECSVFRNIMGWAWDKLYNRSFVLNNDLRFQEQRTTNDMYFTFISLYKASSITTCEQYLYNQRRNVIGSLSATRDKSWECFYNALLELRREFKEMGIWEKYQPDFTDYALNSCLWNLNTLGENAGMKLYEKLKSEWFLELGIVDSPQEWFQFPDEYKQFQQIMQADDDYLSFRLERLKFENTALKQQLDAQYAAAQAAPSSDSHEALFWQRELEATRKSLSFRIGRALTWLPRKILRR